jgi:hypothetical protein
MRPRKVTSGERLSVCLPVLQHGPRVSLGCRSNEFLDHVCLSVLQHGPREPLEPSCPRVSLGCRSNEFLDHAKT